MVTIGLGTFSLSRMRRPNPPQNNTTFIATLSPDRGFRVLPAEHRVQPAGRKERLNAVDSLIAGKLLARQPVADERLVELECAATDVPRNPKLGKRPCQLAAIHPVAPWIRTATLEVSDRRSGNNLAHDLG